MAHSTTGQPTAGSQSSFPQTGSWAMLDFAKLPVQATVGVLSRYAAGRVNPYTVLVCEQLCGNFRLTARARSNIDKAVASLATVGILGTSLEFGFGIEDLVRSMTKSERGTIVLALCAALRETFPLDIATEILIEMARLCHVESEWMPSSREWQALLDACSGVLASTTFGTRAEVLMHFWGSDQRLGAFHGRVLKVAKLRKCSSPKSIAGALSAISAITRDKMQSVCIVGGPDAGWLAAVAEWILDLKVSITNVQGEIIYTNILEAEAAPQVKFLVRTEDLDTCKNIALQERTYVLKDFFDLLDNKATTFINTAVSGRLEWKIALRSAFLADFDDLIKSMPDLFGTMLGSAGRIYKAFAQADEEIPLNYLTACITDCDSSFGPGFVTNTLSWFPELKKLRPYMEKAVMTSLRTARKVYEACIARLCQYCSCISCRLTLKRFRHEERIEVLPTLNIDTKQDQEMDIDNDSELGQQNDSSNFDDDFDWDPNRYCAVILAETIIVLSRLLANVSLNAKVLPMRSGFERAYGRQLSLRQSARSGTQAINDLGQFAFCVDFEANLFIGMKYNGHSSGTRLGLVLELFSGEHPDSVSHLAISAACSNGFCAYLGVLRTVSSTGHGAGMINIIPGRIYYEKKSYTALVDLSVAEAHQFESRIDSLCKSENLFSEPYLSVRESSTVLGCFIEQKRTTEDMDTVTAGPASLADLVATRRGLVPCSRKSGGRKACKKIVGLSAEDHERLTTVGGWLRSGQTYIVHCAETSVAKLVLTYCANRTMDKLSIFIVDKECLDCCLKRAASIEGTQKIYFIYIAKA